LAGWAHHKFGLAIDPKSWKGRDRSEIVRQLQEEARRLYAVKEAELPVRIAFTRFLADRAHHQVPRYDRQGLASWATERFPAVVDAEEIRPMLRPEIEALLLKLAHERYQGARLADELHSKLDAAYPSHTGREKHAVEADPATLRDLAAWAHESLGLE